MLRLTTAFAASLVLAAGAQAATPANVSLAKSLKTKMASVYKSRGSDDVFTKVTCTLKSMATVGHCKAYFTSASLKERGYFDVTISAINYRTGTLKWQPTKVTCTDLQTGKPVNC